eukprot:6487966-Amphidinium_carterae.1
MSYNLAHHPTQHHDHDFIWFASYQWTASPRRRLHSNSLYYCLGFGNFDLRGLGRLDLMSLERDFPQTQSRPTLDEVFEETADLAANPTVEFRKKEKEHRRQALHFLGHAQATMKELYILRASLSPQIKVMNYFLQQNGVAQDRLCWSKLSQGDPLQSRLYLLRSGALEGGFFCKALVESMGLFTDTGLWEDLPRTEKSASMIMRTCLRPAACIYELIIQKCRGFPLKLFDLLASSGPTEAVAESILEVASNHRCLLDDFSKSFLLQFDSLAKLRSMTARIVLASLSEQNIGNTYSTECLHSRHSRRARSRPQTHIMKLHHAALWHHGRAVPPWVLGQGKTEQTDQNQAPQRRNVYQAGRLVLGKVT